MNSIENVISAYLKESKTIKEQNEIIDLLNEALKGEFQQWDLYYTYKNYVRGGNREDIIDHFDEHAEDEAEHINTLTRYLVTMGASPCTERREIPKLEDLDNENIIKLQQKYEQEAVDTYTKLAEILPSGSLRIEIENILATEQEHLHDMQLFLEEDDEEDEEE